MTTPSDPRPLAVAFDDQAQTVTDDGVIVGDEHGYRFASGVGVQCPGPYLKRLYPLSSNY